MQGSIAPSTGQAKLVSGLTSRTVSTVVEAAVGGGLEVAEGTGHVLAVVGQRREIGVGEGQGDDLLVGDGVLQVVQPLLGDRLVLAR